jgi:hypothetical protein
MLQGCGDVKSRLEHYPMERLPFGGRHADGGTNLASMIPGRFEQNRRAHRQIARDMAHQWHR